MWLGRQDSNLGMPESKSGALPLGDAPIYGKFSDCASNNRVPRRIPGNFLLASARLLFFLKNTEHRRTATGHEHALRAVSPKVQSFYLLNNGKTSDGNRFKIIGQVVCRYLLFYCQTSAVYLHRTSLSIANSDIPTQWKHGYSD